MKTKFTQNILFLLLINFLIKPFWVFGVDRSIQNTVGATDYGLYFSLFSFSLIFNIVADLGITNYNNRYIAQNQDVIGEKTGSTLPVKLVISLIYAGITLLAGLLIGYTSYELFLLLLLVFNQIIISITQYLRSNVSGLQLFNTNSILSVVDKLILILLCSWLLWFSPFEYFKIEWLIYSQTFAYLITMFISLLVVIKYSNAIRLQLSAQNMLELLKKSIPFATLIFLMTLYTRIDSIMIERVLPDGKQQAGIYAQAFRILDALYMITVMFGSILLPLFAKLLKEKADIKNLIEQSFSILVIPCAAMFLGIFFYSKDIMQLLYIKHITESSIVLVLLILGFMGIAVGYIFGTLLTADGKLKLLNRIAFTAVIINVVANYFLIPEYGIVGAAFSSMITQIILGCWQLMSSLKIFKFRVKPIILIKYLAFISISFALAYVSYLFIASWYISFVIIMLLSTIVSFLLGILKIEFSFLT